MESCCTPTSPCPFPTKAWGFSSGPKTGGTGRWLCYCRFFLSVSHTAENKTKSQQWWGTPWRSIADLPTWCFKAVLPWLLHGKAKSLCKLQPFLQQHLLTKAHWVAGFFFARFSSFAAVHMQLQVSIGITWLQEQASTPTPTATQHVRAALIAQSPCP